MTADIELLPLPDIERYEVVGDIAYPINSDPNGDYVEYDGHVSAMADYARSVAEHNVASRDAEIEALRAEVRGNEVAVQQLLSRAERLAEPLREMVALGHPRDPAIIAAKNALRDYDQEVGNG